MAMSILGLWPRPSADKVVHEHGAWVYRRLKRIFGPRADIDDAYQSVFVEVIRSLPSFSGRAQLSTWIRRITYNVAYQEMRLRYRRPEVLGLGESNLGSVDLGVELEEREAVRRLYVALEELEPAQRLAVVLHDLEGLTLKEIANQTGRPLPTIASQLATGRARLAQAMKGASVDRDAAAPHEVQGRKESKP
jgi:RNA polymerase sigma-70 factor, ECF subfamily